MAAEIVLALLRANLAAAAAILLVLAVRRLARRLFGAREAYGLWLLVPLTVVAIFIPARVQVIAAAPQALLTSPLLPPVATVVAPALNPTSLAFAAWLVGMLAMLVWLGVRQWRFLQDVERGVAGPAVVGVIRPRVVTPDDFALRFSAREQAVVVAHERTHLARHDARINALVALVRCLCWFNPLVHLAGRILRVDQELACDATVVERHPKARRPYAEALLKAQLAARPLPLGCYWPASGPHPLTERIAMLKSPAPARLRRLAGASAVALLTAGAGFAAWASQPARLVLAPAAASPTSDQMQALPDLTARPVRLTAKRIPALKFDGRPLLIAANGERAAAVNEAAIVGDLQAEQPAPAPLPEATVQQRAERQRAVRTERTERTDHRVRVIENGKVIYGEDLTPEQRAKLDETMRKLHEPGGPLSKEFQQQIEETVRKAHENAFLSKDISRQVTEQLRLAQANGGPGSKEFRDRMEAFRLDMQKMGKDMGREQGAMASARAAEMAARSQAQIAARPGERAEIREKALRDAKDRLAKAQASIDRDLAAIEAERRAAASAKDPARK